MATNPDNESRNGASIRKAFVDALPDILSDSRTASEYDHSTDETETPDTETNAVDEIELSLHAQERWDERTPEWSVDLETAYRHSTPVPELKSKTFEMGGKQPDRVHLFGEHNGVANYLVVLFVSEEVVTTVINLDNLWLISSPASAYLRALGDQQGFTIPPEQRSPDQHAVNP